MKNDIATRADIELMVDTFYSKLLASDEMHYLFFDVANLDMEAHKPILCDFWEGMLFFTGNYRRNTMQKHMDLHFKSALQKKHFDFWLLTFNNTINLLFAGEKAEEAKVKAKSIADVIQMKITGINHDRLDNQ